ncbi:MAG: hypothetical protein CL931_04195 [Deltaproteobacteria bacterium]|nr:hypothetical protein [Deltaproteobacteria bacterium]
MSVDAPSEGGEVAPAAADVLVRLEGVSKAYRDRSASWTSELRNLLRAGPKPRPALDGIDVEVRRGEAVGIVGRNGSGKSTLLRLIAGTLAPSSGRVEVEGRLASLLDLGSGISPEYTGAENARLLGLLAGLTRSETAARVEEIRAFSGLGEAFDRPARSYSSGMLMRLGFSASVHGDPNLLLIDEALAVGDAFFQQRCLRRLREMRDAGVTVVLVSHDPSAIISLCTRCLWLESGRVVEDGAPDEVVKSFLAARYADACELDDATLGAPDLRAAGEVAIRPAEALGAVDRFGDGAARLLGFDARDPTGAPVSTVRPGESVDLVLSVRAERRIARLLVGVTLRNRLGDVITATNSEVEGRALPPLEPREELDVVFRLTWPPLTSGPIALSPAVAEGTVETHRMADWVENALILECLNERGLFGWWSLEDVDVATGAVRREGEAHGAPLEEDRVDEPVPVDVLGGSQAEDVEPSFAFAIEQPTPGGIDPSGVTDDRSIFFRGWCFSPHVDDLSIEFVVADEVVATGHACLFREDVAEVHPAVAHSGRSGFGALVPVPSVAGEVDVELRARTPDGTTHTLETRRLELPPPRPDLDLPAPTVRPTPRAPSDPPRVLFVSHGLAFEGAPIALFDLARSVDRSRLDPIGLAPSDGGLAASWKEAEIPMEIVPIEPFVGGADDFDARIRRLAALIALQRPDAIVANTLETFWAVHVARELGVPALWFVHESEEPGCYFHSRWPTAVADKAMEALGFADATVFVAEATRRLFVDSLPEGRSHVIANGLFVDRFAVKDREAVRARIRRRLGLASDQPLVLCAGTTCLRKGQRELVRSLATLPVALAETHLVLLGVVEGSYLDRIREEIETAGLTGRVSLLPHVEDPRDWFAAADVVACPSFQESLPRVIQEGMASSVAILATDVFGIPELVRDGREGRLVRAGEVPALGETLAALLSDPSVARRMGEAGRARIQAEFSQRVSVAKHEALLTELIASHRDD